MTDRKLDTEINYSGLQKPIPFSERPTCSVAEACSMVGLGRTKFYELIDDGTVETTKIGRRRLVRVPSLLQLLARDSQH